MNNFSISCQNSRIENPRSFYGCFYLGPFEEGQSLTVANALRRTLLSECSGLAITSVLIENVNHEFSTLVGVRDSVLDILLNIKEIVLKKTENPWKHLKKKGVSSVYEKVGMSFFKPVIGYLKVKGPGIVRAKDLRLPPFIKCVDPNQYIATLSEDGFLNMKFVIMEGKGYVVQKSNPIFDHNFVKKRQILLNQLKNLKRKNDQPVQKNGVFLEGRGSFGGQEPPSSNFTLSSSLKTNEIQNEKNSAKNSVFWYGELEEKQTELFKNATPLTIDAVFSPVTKVSYIIEVSENQIIDKETEKTAFIDKISFLLESDNFLKSNLPFLTNFYDKTNNSHQASNTEQVNTSQNSNKEIINHKKLLTELINYIDTFSDSELLSSYRSLHPLSLIKKGSLHTIILEIWTNGSLHPREALSSAFSNLASLFLHLEKSEMKSPIYNNFSSYKKSLVQLDGTFGDKVKK
jgi:DNA-directed RNA polymerase alpha subunit